MKIIYRNFTKLLSTGTFGGEYTLEPMSKYKWNKLLSIAETYGVSDFVNYGIIKTGNTAIPANIYDIFTTFDTFQLLINGQRTKHVIQKTKEMKFQKNRTLPLGNKQRSFQIHI